LLRLNRGLLFHLLCPGFVIAKIIVDQPEVNQFTLFDGNTVLSIKEILVGGAAKRLAVSKFDVDTS
jgi:hypothetical protein